MTTRASGEETTGELRARIAQARAALGLEAYDAQALASACEGVPQAATLAALLHDLLTLTQRQHALLNALPDGLLHASADGALLEVNAQMASMMGTSPERLLTRSAQSLIAPEAHLQRPPQVGEVQAGRLPCRRRTFLREDGGELPVELHMRGLPDGTIVALARDMSQRLGIERDLEAISQTLTLHDASELFSTLATALAQTTGADALLIARVDGADAQIIAQHGLPDATAPRYALAGTPCEHVAQGALCSYLGDALTRFPHDALLQQLGFAHYIGAPMMNAAREPIGFISLMKKQALSDPVKAETLLRIYSARAATELDRSRAIVDLERTRQWLTALVRASPDLIFVVDDQMRFVEALSARSELFYHADLETLRGQHIATALPPEVSDPMIETLQRTLHDGQSHTIHYTLEVPLGRRHFEGRTALLPMSNQAHRAVIVTIRDVTEREVSAMAVREREQKLRLLVEHLPIGAIYVSDAEISFNAAAEAITGYSRDTQWDITRWFDVLYGERADEVRVQWERDRAIGYPEPRQVLLRRSDGAWREIEFHGGIMPGGDAEVWLIQDVSAQRRQELLLARTQEIARVGGWELELKHLTLHFTPLVAELLELAPQQPMPTNAQMLRFYKPHEHAKLREAMLRAIKHGERFDLEVELITARGQERWMRITGAPVRPEGEHTTRVIGAAQDITDSKRAREELLSTQQQLLHSQKMEALGRLAGSVAHDFNNLLGVIIAYAELLRQDPALHEGAMQDLDEVRRAALRAAELTTQLLTFGRRPSEQPSQCDPIGVMLGARRLLAPLMSEAITLIIEHPDALPHVQLQESHLEQILINLALNAHAAMPRGGTLRIDASALTLLQAQASLHGELEPGDYVLLRVCDEGAGMSPEVLERALEPFFTTKAAGRGTGLGLPIVYGIVKQVHGGMRLESALGQGTRALLYLPVALEAPKPHVAPRVARPIGGHETILLAEDDPALANLMVRILQESGYHVLLARDGDQALAIAAAHEGTIDLLVSDVMMPGRNGLEVARAIVQAHRGLKTLFVSGYTADVLSERGVLDDHDAALLYKPFGPDALLREVRARLGSDK